jgi:phosphate transport system permease protein
MADITITARSNNLQKRYRSESRFRIFCKSSVIFAVLFLAMLIGALVIQGWGGFFQTQIKIPVINQQTGSDEAVKKGLLELFPEVNDRADKIQLYRIVNFYLAEQRAKSADGKQEIWVPASTRIDQYIKGKAKNVSSIQKEFIEQLKSKGRIRKVISREFFMGTDSREPEQSGISGSVLGSLLTVIVCILAALPVGVGAALVLEEFMKPSRLKKLIEVNINNLAAVPSIVFGLLGLALYLGFAHMSRSSSLVAGLTLALLVLPTIIITARSAISAVPKSIKYGAIALGATPLQAALHHSLPIAIPGIVTGVILAIARTLGETAPLIMIGMVAFVADIPKNFIDPATTMAVQVYLWSDHPEPGFKERTAALILVLLTILVVINFLASAIRKKTEKRL